MQPILKDFGGMAFLVFLCRGFSRERETALVSLALLFVQRMFALALWRLPLPEPGSPLWPAQTQRRGWRIGKGLELRKWVTGDA